MASIACTSPRVVDVYAEAEAAGRASAALDGKMIDTPVVERARTTLARAAAIERLEARKGAALEAAGEAPRQAPRPRSISAASGRTVRRPKH